MTVPMARIVPREANVCLADFDRGGCFQFRSLPMREKPAAGARMQSGELCNVTNASVG